MFSYDDKLVEYADEDTVLEFANKVRSAGGGEPIEGFFPSEPGEPNRCLIAKALNFGCRVDCPDGDVWEMELSDSDLTEADVVTLADALNCESFRYGEYYGIYLPELIGNAALAFDYAKDGWVVKYRKTER